MVPEDPAKGPEPGEEEPEAGPRPGNTVTGKFAELVKPYDVYGLLIGTVPVAGQGTGVLGSPAGGEGPPVIPIEIVAMSLTGTTPYPVTIREDPARKSSGKVTPGNPNSAFPADSFFDGFFEFEVSIAKGNSGNRLKGTAHDWPTFHTPFEWDGQMPGNLPPAVEPPGGDEPPPQQRLVAAALSPNRVVLAALMLIPPDTDGDGMTDDLDPDDDNDGTPGAEDPRPRPLPYRAVTPAVARDE